jgi:hypothetical protein
MSLRSSQSGQVARHEVIHGHLFDVGLRYLMPPSYVYLYALTTPIDNPVSIETENTSTTLHII